MTIASPRSATTTSTDGTTIGYHSLGAGPGVIVVGGALATADDYLALGRALAPDHEVHLLDRRGRGRSGPQRDDYGMEQECEDLCAVAAATGARLVFGHSYGGLIALEAARRGDLFERLAVYEPGVSINGSIPVGWMPAYARMLAAGDARGAFGCMVRGSGGLPRIVARLPTWYLRAVLRVVVRGQKWARIEPLLHTNLREHEQLSRLDSAHAAYGAIRARTLLIGGTRTSGRRVEDTLTQLRRIIPGATVEILDGLDHFAPSETAPEVIAGRVRAAFHAP